MKAIIIAAGRGIRLGPLGQERPKSLLPILGKPLIEYNLETFYACGISPIAIVVGYKAEQFQYPDLRYYHNDDFIHNNILHSLMKAKDEFTDDIIVSYADIWFSKEVLQNLLATPADIVVSVDTDWRKRYEGRTDHPFSEAEKVILHENGNVMEIGKYIEDTKDGEFIGLMKLSKKAALTFCTAFLELDAVLSKHDPFEQAKEWQKAYVTDFLQWLINKGIHVQASLHKGGWLEMDTKQDYEAAEAIVLKHQ